MGLGETAAKWWKNVDKKNLAILILIFILGFAIRAHLMKYDLVFGFDSYFHARITSYVIEDFVVPEFDPLAYYQEGGAPLHTLHVSFFWYFCAALYKLFTLGAPYNKELWLFFVKLLPALFGALISAGMFLLGKEAYGRKAGVAMGFFAAVIPAFAYRTMAGFLEEDALGFLWMVFGFYFLIKAVKEPAWQRDKLLQAAASGFFFGLMALTWRLFLLVPMVLVAYFVVTLAIMYYRKTPNKTIINFVKLFAIAFAIFAVMATVNDGGVWIENSYNYLAEYLPISPENVARIGSKGDNVLKQTVGEENLGYLFFGNKYNILILFAIAGFFLIPYLVFRRPNDFYSLIFFFWLVITFVMAFNKLKFTYTLGLPIAACGGIFFQQAFEFMKGRIAFEKKAIALMLSFLMLCGVGIGSFFVTQQVPSIEEEPLWVEAFGWIKENTPANAKLFNWWDYGHWMAFMAERGVSNENRNYRSTEYNAHTAKFFLAETEEEALAIVNEYGSDYVVFDTGVLMRQTSFAIFAYNTVDRRDPRLTRYYGNVLKCYKKITPLSGEIQYVCGGDVFREQDLLALPTTWTNTPTQIYEGRTPLFIYRAQNSSRLYILNAAANKTLAAKLIFHDPSITHFNEVFNNEYVRVYQVA